jgi:protein SCO1/2
MRRLVLTLLGLVLLAGAAVAQDYPPPRTMHLPDAAHWFAGLTLTDQDGHALKLYDDLMAGRLLVINEFYANCRAVCPPVMGNIALLQDKAAIEGIKASFVSITVDPAHDTPEMLRLYANGLAVKPGWHLMSGDPAVVQQALHRFGLDTDPNDPSDHLNILYIANLRTGVWKKVFSLTPPEDLARILDEVAAGTETPAPSQ